MKISDRQALPTGPRKASAHAVDAIRKRERHRADVAPGADTRLRRLVDVAVAVVATLVLVPLFLLIAVLIRLGGPGPILYRQPRVGRGGQTFVIWKFRTMSVGADRAGALVSGRADPRITPVGGLLRPTRLDELPQLINILRGDMTLVGPRPEVERYTRYYSEEERRVLTVRPGVLGAGALLFVGSQADELDVAADPEAHYIRHHLHPKLACDLAYLDDRGLFADLRLGWRTVLVLAGVRASGP